MKLLYTALMMASERGYTEIVKALLEKDRINVNVKNIYLFSSKFQSLFQYFKTIIGI